jgi:hypothetical protein
MVLTRSEAKLAFTHILQNVFGRSAGTPLQLALEEEGIDDIFNFVNLDETAISNLQYTDIINNNTVTKVKTGDKMLVKCFLNYIGVRHSEGNPIEDKWDQITQAEFDSFRIDPKYIMSQSSRPSPVSTSAISTARSYTAPLYSSVDTFRRGIKRDATLFPTLKDDKFHDIWHRSFRTQATAQAVSEVLDESYTPLTPDDIALFQEKQKYVYAVLESKVLTDRGKAFIRDHEHDFDAQKAYQKLKAYHLQSTKAKMESSAILSYITSSRLGEGTWNGTTEAFIINWQNQVRLYEKHVTPADHFSDGQKTIMLQNAVHSIMELRQVKNTADQMSSSSGSALTYDTYATLLLSASSSYDDHIKATKSKRQIMLHEIDNYQADQGDYHHDQIDETFDIDCPVSSIQAYATNYRPNASNRSSTTTV